MAATGKLKIKAQELGYSSVDTMMADLLAVHKTAFKVALVLGVYPNAIYVWMRLNADKVPANADR